MQSRTQNSFLRGWNLALEALWQELDGVPDESLRPDAQGFKATLLDWIQERLIDEDLLKPKLTNAQLAEKYSISSRTVTNWQLEKAVRRAGF
jgi:hypothetical protein